MDNMLKKMVVAEGQKLLSAKMGAAMCGGGGGDSIKYNTQHFTNNAYGPLQHDQPCGLPPAQHQCGPMANMSNYMPSTPHQIYGKTLQDQHQYGMLPPAQQQDSVHAQQDFLAPGCLPYQKPYGSGFYGAQAPHQYNVYPATVQEAWQQQLYGLPLQHGYEAGNPQQHPQYLSGGFGGSPPQQQPSSYPHQFPGYQQSTRNHSHQAPPPGYPGY
jgi:hypothetical protein